MRSGDKTCDVEKQSHLDLWFRGQTVRLILEALNLVNYLRNESTFGEIDDRASLFVEKVRIAFLHVHQFGKEDACARENVTTCTKKDAKTMKRFFAHRRREHKVD